MFYVILFDLFVLFDISLVPKNAPLFSRTTPCCGGGASKRPSEWKRSIACWPMPPSPTTAGGGGQSAFFCRLRTGTIWQTVTTGQLEKMMPLYAIYNSSDDFPKDGESNVIIPSFSM